MLVNISTVTGAIMAVIVFIGSVGNFLTLFVITRYPPLHDVTGILLANLAVADFLQSIFGMPLIATSAFQNKWIFGDVLCTLSGITNSLFCITSMLTLSAISVDRWLAIVYPLHHQTFLTIPRARIVVIYVWSHALLVALLPAFGWSRYVYLSYEFICTVQWEHNRAYTIFLCVTSFVAPLFVTVVSYASVMKVACHQAHETLPAMVGVIKAELDHVTTHDSRVIADVRCARNNLKRVRCGTEKMTVEVRNGLSRSNDHFFESDWNDLASKDKAVKLNANLRAQKDTHKEIKRNLSKIEADVTASNCARSQTTVYGNLTKVRELDRWIEADYKPRNLLKKSSRKESRKTNKTETSQGFPAKVRENNKTDKKRTFPVIGKGKDSIYPAYSITPELFHENPKVYRLRRAWTREDFIGSELGIIPEEDETQDSRPDQKSLGHLARVREWMTVKLKNKERAEAILQRKKEMKVVLTLAVVNGTFVLCWLPHFIGITCLTFASDSCSFSDSFFVITTMLAMLNSGCNPFIYTLTYRKFRRAFKRVLPCFPYNRTRSIDQ